MKQRAAGKWLEVGLTGLSKAALCKGTNPEETAGGCCPETPWWGGMLNKEENGPGVRLRRWNLFMQNRNRWRGGEEMSYHQVRKQSPEETWRHGLRQEEAGKCLRMCSVCTEPHPALQHRI